MNAASAIRALLSRPLLPLAHVGEDCQGLLDQVRPELARHGLDASRLYERPVWSWQPETCEELCMELRDRGDHDGMPTEQCHCDELAFEARAEEAAEHGRRLVRSWDRQEQSWWEVSL